MQISVKYFASLREVMGEANAIIDIEENVSISDLWRSIIEEKGVGFENVMMAVNMEYVKPEHQLTEGDEVAFFPPVTGG